MLNEHELDTSMTQWPSSSWHTLSDSETCIDDEIAVDDEITIDDDI